MNSEHLPIERFHSYLDTRGICDDVVDFLEGIEASDTVSWMGAIEGRRIEKGIDVVVYLLPKYTGPLKPYQKREYSRHIAAQAMLTEKVKSRISLDVVIFKPDIICDIPMANEYIRDLASSWQNPRTYTNEIEKLWQDASIIFSVDLEAKVPLTIER